MKALHFGAGNIGRGFVGVILHNAGYELVFADVSAELIDALNTQESYTVHEVGEQPRDIEVTNFSGVNSAQDLEQLYEHIASADLITTAVGPRVLEIIAPTIAEGLRRKQGDKVAILACENAINATEGLARAIREHYPQADDVALFANTAVDRIVPNQKPGQGLDVTVENYFEWVVEQTPFGENIPEIPGVTWVADLEPYITRKLFTVNTGHAATAYFGNDAGITKISDALANPEVHQKVAAVLAETKQLLVEKYEFSEQQQQEYVDKILVRFANPQLPDTTDRVGRAPLRKISEHERFIGPAAQLAQRGHRPAALLDAVGAALNFDVESDSESQELQRRLSLTEGKEEAVAELVTDLCGIPSSHPLFADLLAVFLKKAAQ
ncbi:mannitol-1-phosphate 5-dehydrogenase [Corynebacterium sp. sy017]|uniref:mannitol-1-phosphate 5-dehydrogenase n=1 Tax=unclassified Corynebacterium TaxID=2624378 RepID=UPI001184854F|nr:MULTISPECIES: mannitol-1-phosphate 5-dehydrogenase [unclassified Corynebacterium]MBP3088464.1 mannitol-1-phosphate 5-dehydrogenase [Corynebacterium sp. sy017]TSD91773.1 mannitol-1-phosphate 5-dehydrogenase [Corynebacterium sp. SY003]